MGTLIGAALLIWNILPGLPIVAVPDARLEAAASNRYADRCEIAYNPVWFASLAPRYQQNVVTHEVGHCLGIDAHLPDYQTGLMGAGGWRSDFTGYDRLLYWHQVHAAPYRLVVSY